jgi:hypothetical protein
MRFVVTAVTVPVLATVESQNVFGFQDVGLFTLFKMRMRSPGWIRVCLIGDVLLMSSLAGLLYVD